MTRQTRGPLATVLTIHSPDNNCSYYFLAIFYQAIFPQSQLSRCFSREHGVIDTCVRTAYGTGITAQNSIWIIIVSPPPTHICLYLLSSHLGKPFWHSLYSTEQSSVETVSRSGRIWYAWGRAYAERSNRASISSLHQSAPRFFITKLFEFFVHPPLGVEECEWEWGNHTKTRVQ